MKRLSLDHLAKLDNFGHSIQRPAYLFAPASVEELEESLQLARRHGLSIALRGSGRSYGDAALNSGQIVLDLRGLNRILEWDPQNGLIRVESGVTIQQLWQHILGDGWWPPVVPGTMFPTLGGCLAANVHGKNNWMAGTLGEQVLAFEALLPNGKRLTCTATKNKELFHAMIGGMGLLGVFTSITLQMKQIQSGNLAVSAWTEPTLAGMLQAVDANKTADYIVGWIDCTARGRALGRGQIHRADYLHADDDPEANRSLRVDYQTVPDRVFALLPKAWLPFFMRPFTNNLGAPLVNFTKYWSARTLAHNKHYQQSLVAFNFLLDYVPSWERSYGRGGLIQYQSFVPKDTAEDAFAAILRLCQRRRLPSYLGVVKRHRPDNFLLSHAVDGYSLALDFRVTPGNRARLQALADELDQIVLAAGGRFYFAKDSTLNAEKVRRYLGDDTVDEFAKLKRKIDPDGIFQSDLYRRCFGQN